MFDKNKIMLCEAAQSKNVLIYTPQPGYIIKFLYINNIRKDADSFGKDWPEVVYLPCFWFDIMRKTYSFWLNDRVQGKELLVTVPEHRYIKDEMVLERQNAK